MFTLRQLIQIAGTSTEAEDPNFSKQLRHQFSKKNASKDRDYCILLIMELSSHSSQNQNPRKLCKVLKWVRDIFLIQLDPNHPANREPKEDKLSMSTIEKSSPLTGRSSLSPILSQSERSNLLTFETLVSQNLQLALTCQSSEDRELSKLAGELNKLIKERIIDIIKWEKDRGTNKLFFRIFEGLQSLIASQQSKVVGFAYEWVENLLENFPGEVTSQSDAMVKNLSDPKIGLVTTSVVLIAKIAKKQESTRLLESIMDYLQTAIRDGEQTFDQEKGFAILRTLFFHFQSSDHDKLLSFLTEYLAKSPESVFHTTVVRNLNLIITLEESLFEVRNLLKSDSSLFFDMIFKTWAISLSCALNLSILSQRYEGN